MHRSVIMSLLDHCVCAGCVRLWLLMFVVRAMCRDFVPVIARCLPHESRVSMRARDDPGIVLHVLITPCTVSCSNSCHIDARHAGYVASFVGAFAQCCSHCAGGHGRCLMTYFDATHRTMRSSVAHCVRREPRLSVCGPDDRVYFHVFSGALLMCFVWARARAIHVGSSCVCVGDIGDH